MTERHPEHRPERSEHSRLYFALRPRASRSQAVVALLCALLGFALATQVHAQRGDALSTARESDLLGILDNLSARSDRLRAEIADQQQTLSKLSSGADTTQAALQDAQSRVATLGVLAGTAPARGPGVTLTISDPDRAVQADVLLNILEELRDAGAEAIEIEGAPLGGGNTVRLVASSHFVDAGEEISVDGLLLDPPFRFSAIGDPHTLATAMQIPGGVLETLRSKGADGTVTQRDSIDVTAVVPVASPKFAKPAPTPAGQ